MLPTKLLTIISLLLLECRIIQAFASELDDVVTIRDIVETREFSGLDVCSAHNLIALRIDSPNVAKNRVYHDWIVIDLQTGKVRTTSPAGESLITFGVYENVHPQWSPDCQWMYYRARNNSEVQIWRLNTISGAIGEITSDEADILDFSLIEDGRSIVYTTGASRAAISAAETNEYRFGVLYDETAYPLFPPLTKAFPIAGRWGSVRKWNKYSEGHLLSQESPTYKTITIKDGKNRKANKTEVSELLKAPGNNVAWFRTPNAGFSVSPSGNHIAALKTTKRYRYSGDTRVTRLISLRHDDPEYVRECLDPHCEGENIAFLKWSSDASSIYFLSDQANAAGIYAWTPESGIVRTIHETEGTLGAFASAARYKSMPCPITEETAFCTAADHSSPPHLLAISLRTGETNTVFDPNPDLRKKFTLKTERIRWLDNFNRQALGVLAYPRGFKNGIRYPLVITTYKCRGFLNGGLADGAPEYVLAENGFLVLCIDFNYDLPPLQATAEYSPGPGRYVAALSEYETAIDFLAKNGIADRERVGITGISMSANFVSYALTHSAHFHVASTRALGVWGPERELLSGHPRSQFIAGQRRIHNMKEDGSNAESVYRDLAVTRRAERVQAPILVQASDSEYLQSLPSVNVLLRKNKPIEMHVFPNETHLLHQPIHRYVNYERNLDWFRFWLQAHEDPDPEKEEQYARWREMRDEHCAQQSNKADLWYCRQ